MTRLAIAVALFAGVFLGVGAAGIQRADRALDLWTCHAKVGYGHPDQLDACLLNR